MNHTSVRSMNVSYCTLKDPAVTRRDNAIRTPSLLIRIRCDLSKDRFYESKNKSRYRTYYVGEGDEIFVKIRGGGNKSSKTGPAKRGAPKFFNEKHNILKMKTY